MNDVRTMLVQDTFRVTGGAAGIAKAARVIFIDINPFEVTVFGIYKLTKGRIVAFLAVKLDIMFHRFKLWLDQLDDRCEHFVEK